MPTTRIGKCPWCERHKQTLYLISGIAGCVPWIQWVCAECIQACGKLKEVSENG